MTDTTQELLRKLDQILLDAEDVADEAYLTVDQEDGTTRYWVYDLGVEISSCRDRIYNLLNP